MDLIQRKVKYQGDYVYFVAASIERPFDYIRCYGRIDKVADLSDRIFYHIAHVKFMETTDYLRNEVHGRRFRMKNNEDKYFDKRLFIFDANSPNALPDELMKERYSEWQYDVSAAMTFDTIDELNMEFDTMLIEMRDLLKNFLANVENRIKHHNKSVHTQIK